MPPRRRAASSASAPPPVSVPEEPIYTDVGAEANADAGAGGNADTEETEIEHVVLQLPIPAERLDELLNKDGMNIVPTADITAPQCAATSAMREPTPYVAQNSFVSEAQQIDTAAAVHTPTPSVCFWCCHNIEHRTFGMPIRFDRHAGTFTTYGSFCSFECAAAHNFSVHMGSDRAWEIHSWIQMLGRRFGYTQPVRPAPSRYLLKMFNGPMTIEEFRAAHLGQTRTTVLNIPPMISAPSQIEILNTSYITTKSDGTCAPKKRAAKNALIMVEST